jgi:hypothetical protein
MVFSVLSAPSNGSAIGELIRANRNEPLAPMDV